MTEQEALDIIEKEMDTYSYDEEVEKALVIFREMKQREWAKKREGK